VLYASGYADDRRGQGQDVPDAAQFLAKPFSTDSLLTKVREILGR
jgi:hypothetical protein